MVLLQTSSFSIDFFFFCWAFFLQMKHILNTSKDHRNGKKVKLYKTKSATLLNASSGYLIALKQNANDMKEIPESSQSEMPSLARLVKAMQLSLQS